MSEQNRYQELDSLRGIAALLVVFFHLTKEREEYNQIFKLGTTGVDLFFIISGFVIFMSLQKISNGLDFVINRASRLYPTYWASVLFTFILITAHSLYKGTFNVKADFIQFIGNLTMFQFYLRIPDLDGPYWTMIIEMIFYISILALFQLKLLRYINTIGVVLCSFAVLLTHYFHDIWLAGKMINGIPLLQFLPLFFAGIIFYKMYTNHIKQLSGYLIIVFCLLCQFTLFPYVGRSHCFINWTEYMIMLTLYFILFTLFVNFKLNFIVNRTTLFFGKISFALYLIHQYVSLTFIIPLFNEELGINFWVVVFFINLPIVIAIATFITYAIEIPYSKIMREKLRKVVWQKAI